MEDVIELDIHVVLSKHEVIPAYIGYLLDGSNTVEDLIETVCEHYGRPELANVLKRRYSKVLKKRLEEYGFPGGVGDD